MAELDDATFELVKRFSAEGDALAAAGDYGEAIHAYDRAWALLPEPKSQWTAATWILAAIADAGFLGGFLRSARCALDYVMLCPDAMGNPFLHLRRGEVLFEQENYDAAADDLMRAYMGGGPELFAEETAKYLDFLRSRAGIP